VNFYVSRSVLIIGINVLSPITGYFILLEATVSAILEGLLTGRKNVLCECVYRMIYIVQSVS